MRMLMIFGVLMLAVGAAEAKQPDCFALETTAATQDCLVGQIEKADAELNLVYASVIAEAKHIKASMDGEMGSAEVEEHIRVAQRAWNDWRTKECLAQAEFLNTGGSIVSLTAQACSLRLLQERTETLRGLFKNQQE